MNTLTIAVLAACALTVSCQLIAAPVELPQPYSFGYVSNDIEGSHGHEETGDGSGRVSGRYSLSLADGRTRTVTYVADEFGYRADVVTNEPGTESRPAADTTFTSTALSGPDAAHAADAALLGVPFRASS